MTAASLKSVRAIYVLLYITASELRHRGYFWCIHKFGGPNETCDWCDFRHSYLAHSVRSIVAVDHGYRLRLKFRRNKCIEKRSLRRIESIKRSMFTWSHGRQGRSCIYSMIFLRLNFISCYKKARIPKLMQKKKLKKNCASRTDISFDSKTGFVFSWLVVDRHRSTCSTSAISPIVVVACCWLRFTDFQSASKTREIIIAENRWMPPVFSISGNNNAQRVVASIVTFVAVNCCRGVCVGSHFRHDNMFKTRWYECVSWCRYDLPTQLRLDSIDRLRHTAQIHNSQS